MPNLEAGTKRSTEDTHADRSSLRARTYAAESIIRAEEVQLISAQERDFEPHIAAQESSSPREEEPHQVVVTQIIQRGASAIRENSSMPGRVAVAMTEEEEELFSIRCDTPRSSINDISDAEDEVAAVQASAGAALQPEAAITAGNDAARDSGGEDGSPQPSLAAIGRFHTRYPFRGDIGLGLFSAESNRSSPLLTRGDTQPLFARSLPSTNGQLSSGATVDTKLADEESDTSDNESLSSISLYSPL